MNDVATAENANIIGYCSNMPQKLNASAKYALC